MSTIADIITGVRQDIKDTSTPYKVSDSQIVHYMNRFRIHIAALQYRNQCYGNIKSANTTLTSGTKTYAIPTDFYAEAIGEDGKNMIHFSNKSDMLRKTQLTDYVKGGFNTASSTGTSGRYMILGQLIYLFDPVPSGGTLTIWYHYLDSAFNTASTTTSMPYDGLLDEYWRGFVSSLLQLKNEYDIQAEFSLFKELENHILGALVGRSPAFRFIPRQGAGPGVARGIDAVYT